MEVGPVPVEPPEENEALADILTASLQKSQVRRAATHPQRL